MGLGMGGGGRGLRRRVLLCEEREECEECI